MDFGLNIDLSKQLDEATFEVHIKIQQRNRKKCWTIIEGLDKIEKEQEKKDKFVETISSQFKKMFNCGATIKKPEYHISMQGDHREGIKKFLLDKGYVTESQIKIHGC
jgi:translation initiation factor SUI1